MRFQWEIVTSNPTDASKLQTRLCFLKSRALFPTINSIQFIE